MLTTLRLYIDWLHGETKRLHEKIAAQRLSMETARVQLGAALGEEPRKDFNAQVAHTAARIRTLRYLPVTEPTETGTHECVCDDPAVCVCGCP